MSRIGKKPIEIPAKTKVEVKGQMVHVEGPRGKLEWTVPAPIKVEVKDGKVVTSTTYVDRVGKARWGLSRSLIANMVKGVNDGFTVNLEINGVGYRAAVQGQNLQLQLGYSHDLARRDDRPGSPEGERGWRTFGVRVVMGYVTNRQKTR